MANSNMLMVYIQCSGTAPINASLEALSKAVELAKAKSLEVAAVLIGKFDGNTENVCKEFGASKIIEVAQNGYNIQSAGEVLYGLVEKYAPLAVFAGAASEGKEITAYAAAKFGVTPVSNVCGVKIESDLEFTIALYGGAVLRDINLKSDKTKFVVLSAGAFKKAPNPAANAEIVKESFPDAEKDLRAIIKESVSEIAESVNLEEAEVIIACGRGMGTEEGLKLLNELAKVLGGAIGATRPVTESGLVAKTQQVGQSGKIVSPKLYIGCGVSGAVQHISGILGSNYIVAINKDEDAAIFDVADVGIVRDGMAVVPLLIEEIKKIK